MKWLWFLGGFLLGCAVTAAAGLAYREYRRSLLPKPDAFHECVPNGANSIYPLHGDEVAKILAKKPSASYAPPAEFDYDVNIEALGGRYCIGWRGACRWFEYPPTSAVKDGDCLVLTLCLGGASRAQYRLRPVGQSLEFVD